MTPLQKGRPPFLFGQKWGKHGKKRLEMTMVEHEDPGKQVQSGAKFDVLLKNRVISVESVM
jgi:hypothetical protein